MGFFEKIKQGLSKTRDGMKNSIGSVLKSFSKIDEDLLEALEETLILSDIGTQTSGEIIERLRQRVREKHLTQPLQIQQEIKEIICLIYAS